MHEVVGNENPAVLMTRFLSIEENEYRVKGSSLRMVMIDGGRQIAMRDGDNSERALFFSASGASGS